ncbi:MAG: hypothetical protein VYA88_03300 [Actinomycetota bacterium]|nr:hypothetical protein [Actinomycetota bacterium]
MNLLVVLFILALISIGASLTFATNISLRLEERVCFGVVIGSIAVSLLGFVTASLIGVNGIMVLITIALGFVMVSPLIYRNRSAIKLEAKSFRTRASYSWKDKDSPRPLIAILLLSSVVTIRILQNAFQTSEDGGITAGHLSVYGDWSAHLAYVSSFAYADNFSLGLPTASGETFAYHFGVDWFSAMFIPLGSGLLGSLEVSTALLAIAFPAVMFIVCERLCSNRAAAGISVGVFLTAGGTGALYRFFIEDLPNEGPSILTNLPRSYAFDGFDRNWVDNPVTGFLYPQRPTLIGFSSTLIIVLLFWLNRENRDRKTYFFTGVFTGLLPVFHVFAFGAVLLIGGCWLVLNRSKSWLYFLVPSLALGLPVLIWQLPERDGSEWHTFWMLGKSSWERTPLDFFSFWFLNTGLFIPLALAGTVVTFKKFGFRFIPVYAFLIIPNIAIWHFWPGNNAKYVIFFLLLASPLVGEVLSRLFVRTVTAKILATLLIISLSTSGMLDIWRAFEGNSGPYPANYLSGKDVLVGEWARENTEQKAVFASANNNVHPIRALAGRTVVSGAPGRLNDLGVDWYTRDQDLRTLYMNPNGADQIIRRYQIDYIVVGPYEQSMYTPQSAHAEDIGYSYSDNFGKLVYDIGGYRIFETQGRSG